MSACAAQTFEQITQETFNCLLAKAESYGIVLVGESGQSTKDGFTVTWNYNANAQTLQIQCTDSPWWAPCTMINDKIQELVAACR